MEVLKSKLQQAEADLANSRSDLSAERERHHDATPETEEQVKLLIRAEKSERRSAAVEEEMMEMTRLHAREVRSARGEQLARGLARGWRGAWQQRACGEEGVNVRWRGAWW